MDLGTFVGAGAGDAWATQCEAEATDLADRIIGDVQVPDEARDRAILEGGTELFFRRDALLGNTQMDDGAAAKATVRISRDPARAMRAVLAAYLGPSIA